MTAFQCIAIATVTADRFRTSNVDDNGNAVRRIDASDGGSFPCRHCLDFARPGETMLLGSYDLPRPRGIYWTPSPIFVHAEACPRFSAANIMPPIIGEGSLVSVRAYDEGDQCVYELGQVCPGAEVGAPLQRALTDIRTAFVNVHTARPGCLLSRVERQAGA